MSAPTFYYREGLAVLRGAPDAPGWMVRDRRLGAWVAPGHRLPELRTWAGDRGIPERGEGPDRLEAPLFDLREPRRYQRQALERWVAQGRRGSVVLPTGAGKRRLGAAPADGQARAADVPPGEGAAAIGTAAGGHVLEFARKPLIGKVMEAVERVARAEGPP